MRSAKREFPQYFPQPGWVEHDADEIWDATVATLGEVARATEAAGETIACIGITNQRETVVVWSRRTGRPLHRAIVWQDRRTAEDCDERRAAGLEPLIRERTGLVLDPYFSASKLAWLLHEGGVEASARSRVRDRRRVAAVPAHRRSRARDGSVQREPDHALRHRHRCSGRPSSASSSASPTSCLPEVRPSSGRFGVTDPDAAAGLSVPVSGIAGDQQAALFGQACFEPGMAKNTYGTGSFVLVNLGATRPEPAEGLLTTVAWQVGAAPTVYAMEGAIFVTGAAIQWLRDGLGIITDAAETGPLAASVPDSGGVMFVPAFTGLGSPYWDPYARGTILGLTRGTGRAQIARAVVESMAYQTRDVVDAVTAATGTRLAELRIDGGASVMDLLAQLQADLLGVTVRRPAVQETTALGAAYLAGLAEGVWASPAEAADAWIEEASFTPAMPDAVVDAGLATWRRAVERSRDWAHD